MEENTAGEARRTRSLITLAMHTVVFMRKEFYFTMNVFSGMSNQELIAAESKLDFRDPDILAEIFRRAEEIEPGITEQYNNSFVSYTLDSDSIFDRAISYLK